MIVHTASGQQLRLGAEIARGGEARVVHVPERPGEVAKLYLQAQGGRHRKLEVMVSSPPHDPTLSIGHASIAWPRMIVVNERREAVGYVMPYIRGAVPLVEVFNPRRRAGVLPGFDDRYLYRAARNLASALDALHARDYVVGDLNERNVLVTPRALVTLIDTDSFQVQQAQQGRIVVYPCPVGRSEYTPPELQGQAFRDLVRRPEHDRFGLAVLVFQLLAGGSHPFRCLWRGAGDPPPLEERIRRGWYPHGSGAPREVVVPPGLTGLAGVPPDVTALLERCFADGHANPGLRPTAAEWARGLGEAEDRLRTCSQGHYFGDHLRRCPQCNTKVSARRPTRSTSASPAPKHSAATASPTTASVGTGAVAVARPPRAAVMAEAVLAPARAARRRTMAAARAVQAAPAWLASLPMHFLLLLLSPRRRQAAAAAWRPLRARLAWTLSMAAAGGVAFVAIATGAALALAAVEGSRLTPAVAQPMAAAGIGGLAGLLVVGTFQHLSASPDRRLSRRLLQAALGRSLSGGAGWVTGWTASAISLGPLVAAVGMLAAVTQTPAQLATPMGQAAWSMTWAGLGAVAGAVAAVGQARPPAWAFTGAVFGAVAYAAARVAVALLAGVG